LTIFTDIPIFEHFCRHSDFWLFSDIPIFDYLLLACTQNSHIFSGVLLYISVWKTAGLATAVTNVCISLPPMSSSIPILNLCPLFRFLNWPSFAFRTHPAIQATDRVALHKPDSLQQDVVFGHAKKCPKEL
jgi:hypothetical protein